MTALDRLLERRGSSREKISPRSTLGRILHRGGVRDSQELRRISMLPTYRWQDDPELPAVGRYLETEYGLPLRTSCRPRCQHKYDAPELACPECLRAREACPCRGAGIMHLRPVQIAALQTLHDHRGLLANARVGAGKTLISYLAGAVTGADRTLVLIPAALRTKTERDFALLKRHWCVPRRIRLMSYELLSRDRGLAELNAYRPDLIVADEAYCVKNVRAASTARLHKYLTQTHPDAMYCDMSGTMTKRSILDYHHRMMWALEDGTQPLPREIGEARHWAEALDEKVSRRKLPGALLRFCTPAEIHTIATDTRKDTALRVTREGYARRLLSAPGVVGTEEMFDGAMSLRITGHEFEPGPQVVEAFRTLRETWCLPDGHPIDSPAELWRHARELVQGLFYRWDPPAPRDWLMVRKQWSAACRQILRDYRDIDPRTPLGATRLVDDGRASWAKEALENWRAIKNTFQPRTVATWIDDACLRWVAQWAKRHTGIIWCWETEFARRLSEQTHLPYYGSHGLCDGRMIEDEKKTCIASIKANCKGRNLQHFAENLIVSIPPGGEMHEQLLGRTHRDYQEADEVTADLLLGCYEQWEVFRQACRDAEYVERTMRQAQKLNFATIEVASEETIARRHAAGDPLWNRENAQFFDGAARYHEPLVEVKNV